MSKKRKYATWALLILALGFLPGSDIECEDGEFEFDIPSFDFDDDDYYDDCCYEEVYYEPVFCCY